MLLFDKNTQKPFAYSTKIPIFAAKRRVEEHQETHIHHSIGNDYGTCRPCPGSKDAEQG